MGAISAALWAPPSWGKSIILNKSQAVQTLARQRWCLPRKGNVYRQRSWKSSNTSVSVWLLLIAPADLGSVWKHHYYKKTLFLSSSKWDLWISSTGRRGSLLCLSLLTQDCRVKIFPSGTETVGPVLNQFVHARCSRDSTSSLTREEHTPLSLQYPCRQFSMLISRTINVNFADPLRGGLSTLYPSPRSVQMFKLMEKELHLQCLPFDGAPGKSTYSRKEPIWKESCLESWPFNLRCLTLVDLVCVCQNSNLMTKVEFFWATSLVIDHIMWVSYWSWNSA